jgi:mycothiol synthase
MNQTRVAVVPAPATNSPPPPALPGEGGTIRPYRGLDDIAGMAAANDRLRRHVHLLEPVEVEPMRHRYAHLVNSDPLVDCLVAEHDGRTVGYTRLEWHDLADGDRVYHLVTVVEPDSWGRGIGDAFVDWGEARSRIVARSIDGDRRSWFESWAFGGDDEHVGALVRHGYAAVREEAEMLRPDLDAIPAAAVADGYILRTPTGAELPMVFDMMVLAFQEHWGEYDAGDQRLDRWIEDPRFQRDLVVVAWRGGEPVACVSNLLEPAPDGSVRGVLDSVCTHPGHRRRGLGRAVVTDSLRRLRAAGASSAYLSVDTGNRNQAVALYESCGFRIASRSTT